MKQIKPHMHVDERGFVTKCYHECKNVLWNASFWIGMTIGFPLEHFLYEKVWPFKLITEAMGL